MNSPLSPWPISVSKSSGPVSLLCRNVWFTINWCLARAISVAPIKPAMLTNPPYWAVAFLWISECQSGSSLAAAQALKRCPSVGDCSRRNNKIFSSPATCVIVAPLHERRTLKFHDLPVIGGQPRVPVPAVLEVVK